MTEDVIRGKGEVVSREERIRELQTELNELYNKGDKSLDGYRGGALEGILGNPNKMKELFSVNDRQAQNIKSIMVGTGTAAAVKYLGDKIGTKPAAILGALGMAIVTDKMFPNR